MQPCLLREGYSSSFSMIWREELDQAEMGKAGLF